jgi:branched-chain amino acid transport system substrate-binding protein
LSKGGTKGEKMRRSVFYAFLAAAVISVSGDAAYAEDTLDIPVILPLTGGAAFLGKAEADALQRYEKVVAATGGVHGKTVHFVISDDTSSPQLAVQLLNEVKASNPPVVLGSALSALCNAMIPLVRRGPVMYCFSPSIQMPPDGYVFSSGVSVPSLADALLRYIEGRGWKKVAIITSSDATGQDAQKNLKALLDSGEFKDLTVVENVQFNPTDVSVSAQIQRIKGANPDVLITWASGAPIGTVFQGIRDAGLDVPVTTPNSNMTYAQMNQYAQFLPKDLYVPTSAWPKTDHPEPAAVTAAKDTFFKAYEGTNIKPDAPSTFAWDPAVMVVEALRKLKPDANADELRDHLANSQDFVGINGGYDFKSVPYRGIDKKNVLVTRWDPKGQAWVPVSEAMGVPFKN